MLLVDGIAVFAFSLRRIACCHPFINSFIYLQTGKLSTSRFSDV